MTGYWRSRCRQGWRSGGLADPTRLGILLALQEGERRVANVVGEVDGSQAYISGYLACLKDCGLIADRAQGRATPTAAMPG